MLARKFSSLFMSIAAILVATPAHSDVKDGVDAWSRGDYTSAIKEWKKQAEAGDPDAQFNLAQAYRMGKGVDQDMAMAEKLYGEAAGRGHLQAADNYGLLLFQRGERASAMPFIHAAADRGEPRARYILGLAYFNGDHAPKDWVRAYALVSLARQAGLEQATTAQAEMDKFIPLEQRQQSVLLASQLAAQAAANRTRLTMASNLDGGPPHVASGADGSGMVPIANPAPYSGTASGRPAGPAFAGADFTRPMASPPAVPNTPALASAVPPKAQAAAKPASGPAPPKPPISKPGGAWRVQLGAFGVASNADALWAKVRKLPELAGHSRFDITSGRLTKLQAGGFASHADAAEACAKLERSGYQCLPLKE